MSTVATLKKQIAEAQAKLEAETSKLQAERARLVARLAQIDAELGGDPKPVKARAKGVSEAVLAFVTANPASTIREVQAGLPDLPASSVETNIRAMAAKGTLKKDESVPRRFSVPAPASPPAPTKVSSNGNGARPH